MKFSTGALLCLMATSVSAKKSKSTKEPVCPLVDFTTSRGRYSPYLLVDYKPYLIGLLTLPHTFMIPGFDKTTARDTDVGPLQSIPIVGITDITDVLTNVPTAPDPKTGEFTSFVVSTNAPTYYTMVGEGYGTSDKSADFPLHYHKIRFTKEMVYNHGGKKFNIYDPVEWQESILITDPDELISWKSEWDGHPLNIQVVYDAPADWLTDWKPDRVLTGRDFSPEGLATITQTCAVVAEKWGPSIFAMDPETGKVKSGLVPVPDIARVVDPLTGLVINEWVLNPDKLLTTVSDKRHCYLHEVAANNCGIVPSERVTENGFFEYQKNADGKKVKVFVRKFTQISTEQGWAGIVRIFAGGEDKGQAPVIGMFHSTLSGESGPRIYGITPGDCSADCSPAITSFEGFYPFSRGANRIGAFTNVPGSQARILVHEHNAAFPTGTTFPRAMPRDRLCIFDLEPGIVSGSPSVRATWQSRDKECILDFIHIPDPYDVQQDGSGIYAHSQRESGGLKIVDNYCVLVGTDNGFPLAGNDYGLEEDLTAIPFFMEVTKDNRFFFVCFIEPVFSNDYPLLTITTQ